MQVMRGVDLLKLLQRIVAISHGSGLVVRIIPAEPGRIQRSTGGEYPMRAHSLSSSA
jgi:hypothetical protein